MIRRILAGVSFVVVFFTVLGGAHYYLAQRMVLDPNWPVLLWGPLLLVLALGLATLVLQSFLRRRVGIISRTLSWSAYIWLGFSFLLLVLTAASDLMIGLLGMAISTEVLDDGSWLVRGRALTVGSLALALSGLALRQGLQAPDIKRVEIALEGWPSSLDGFRIVQISDLHIGPLIDAPFAAEVARRVNLLDPDLVAVTGDLVDGSVSRIGKMVEPLGAIRAKHGVFFVTGNHDHYSGADEWVARIQELGWKVLRNERVTIGTEDAAFDLAGVDDRHASLLGESGEDLERALADRDPERNVILLAHDPGTFRDASKRAVDLQLSGHTHGGQIWPFRWAVRAVVPWVAGLYRVGSAQLYVSRGTGFWGPPMRLGAPAEISEIVLRGS